jgi:peptidoglycan/LPS O-acetylase OafA/YrhL
LAIAAVGDVFMALTYTSNLPVFPEWFPDMKWMSHTWSLSVEEQFYLIWPLVLWLTLKSQSKRLIVLVTSLIIIVTILMRFCYPSLSYGILRWDAIMLGCLLNFFQINRNKIIVFLSIAVLCFYSWNLPDPIRNFDYFITSVVAFAFISQSKFLRFLNSKPLVYFGKISYSLYLWHFFFMRLGYSGWLNLSVSLILSDISYRFFELPILNWAKLRFQLIR